MAAAAAIDTPFGHSLPPEGPHTVTMHAPGWTTALRFRDGDLTIINQLKSIYPRFFPFGPAAQVPPPRTPFLPAKSYLLTMHPSLLPA